MSGKKVKTDKATLATLTASPLSRKGQVLKPDETTLTKQTPDEATVAFWRLRQAISVLPLEIKLKILFWWLMDHLHLFEYWEDVSVLCYLFF